MARALIPKGGNDIVYTPDILARAIVEHFRPDGLVLEPCAGGGAFVRQLPGCLQGDLETGQDFLIYDGPHVDWIVTNPPWSKFRPFLIKAMQVADNIVFLVTVNHFFTKARIRAMVESDFAFVEVCFVDTPTEFPQSGFQLAAVHIKKGYTGKCLITAL